MIRPASSRWPWLLVLVLMLGEFLLFDRMTSVHHAKFYPRWNDQIQYLTEAYAAYEKAQAGGFLAGLSHALGKTAPQGTLHDTAALCVFTIVGSASRSAALSLNMLVFLAWQGALFFTTLRLTGSRPLAWIAFGLALCGAFPWSNQPGSAVDFRLDHAAMCLMGLSACAALLSDGFRHRGWALLFGGAVGLTLLTRFLTGAYFAVVFVGIATWLLLSAGRWRRLAHLVAAGGVAALLAGPAFWRSREALYNYYWVGHIAGAESDARTPGLGLVPSLQLISGQLASLHLGAAFAWVAGATLLILALLALTAPQRSLVSRPRSEWLLLAGLFLILPGLVLAAHRQKSDFVLGVLVPGALLLVIGLAAALVDRIALAPPRRWPARVYAALASLVVLAGCAYFAQRQLTPAHDPQSLASARTVNAISDRIYTTALARQIHDPYIAVDQVVDYLDAQILAVTCYERQKRWTNFVIQLPNSILEEADEAILYKLKLCHFVVLTDEMPGHGHWPYDRQMRRLYPQLKAWCVANLELLEVFEVYGRKHSLYTPKLRS